MCFDTQLQQGSSLNVAFLKSCYISKAGVSNTPVKDKLFYRIHLNTFQQILMSILNTGPIEVLWAFAYYTLLWHTECIEEKNKVKGVVSRRWRHIVQCNHIYYFVDVDIRPLIVIYESSTYFASYPDSFMPRNKSEFI